MKDVRVRVKINTQILYKMECLIHRILASNSPFEIIGVPETATHYEINRAYKKLALCFHPDKFHHPQAEEVFKRINRAKTQLLGSESEKQYLKAETFSEDVRRRMAEIKAEYERMREEIAIKFERKRAFREKFGQCSDDQWMDDGTGGWDVLPKKTQNKNRRRK